MGKLLNDNFKKSLIEGLINNGGFSKKDVVTYLKWLDLNDETYDQDKDEEIFVDIIKTIHDYVQERLDAEYEESGDEDEGDYENNLDEIIADCQNEIDYMDDVVQVSEYETVYYFDTIFCPKGNKFCKAIIGALYYMESEEFEIPDFVSKYGDTVPGWKLSWNR